MIETYPNLVCGGALIYFEESIIVRGCIGCSGIVLWAGLSLPHSHCKVGVEARMCFAQCRRLWRKVLQLGRRPPPHTLSLASHSYSLHHQRAYHRSCSGRNNSLLLINSMLGSVILPMPTDLGKPAHSFEVDSPNYGQRRGITRLTVDIPSSRISAAQDITSHPHARWRTPEFLLYAVVFAVVVPMMAWIPVRLSNRTFQL